MVPPPSELEAREGLVRHAHIRIGRTVRLCFRKETTADQTNIDREIKGCMCMGLGDIEVLPTEEETLGGTKPTKPKEEICKSCQGLLTLDSSISRTSEAIALILVDASNVTVDQGKRRFTF